jgi:hypothetical protein
LISVAKVSAVKIIVDKFTTVFDMKKMDLLFGIEELVQ